MIDQLRDETHSSWFVFSHEGCGLLFLHSIMETLCSSFQLSFQQLFLCTIDKLLQHWRRIESTGNCAQEIEENCLSSAVNGLIYMLRGLQEMNRDTFVSITSQYAQQAIDSSSAFFPYAAKYIILSSVAFSLSFFSQSQQKSVLGLDTYALRIAAKRIDSIHVVWLPKVPNPCGNGCLVAGAEPKLSLERHAIARERRIGFVVVHVADAANEHPSHSVVGPNASTLR